MSNEFLRRIELSINFHIVFVIIMIAFYFTPEILADSDSFNTMYKQINFNSYHFEFYKLIIYVFSISLGFILINQFTTGVEITKRYSFGFGGALSDFFITLGYSLIIFFISGNTVLSGSYDYEGFCDERGLSLIQSHKKDGHIGNFIYIIMSDVKRLYSFKFLENFLNINPFVESNKNNLCVMPGFFEISLLNLVFYFYPLLIGLNFTAITDNIQCIKYLKMNWNKKKNWERKHWFIIYGLITFLVLNVVFHFVNFARDSWWKFFIFSLLFLFIGGYILYRYFISHKKTKELDFTNPTLIMFVIIFVNLRCVYDLILLGFLSGLLASSAGRNGIRDIFKERDLDNYKTCNFVPTHVEIEKKEFEDLDK
jgi:hypothetical protein